MALKIKKRCIRCLTVLRENGTCPNEECPKYVLEAKQQENENAKETTGKVNKYDNTSDPERSSDTE